MKNVAASLNRVLVIDDVPVIAFGLLETFTLLNKSVTVAYESNVFSALSSPTLVAEAFDLLVIGVLPHDTSTSLSKMIVDLKKRFGHPKLMLYASNYCHSVIEKMDIWSIDAYVHRSESMEEIQNAYTRISMNERYISELFYTLYNDYCLTRDWMEPGSQFISMSPPEKNILLLLCQGKGVQEIAYILHTPVNEIHMHLNMFRNRLND
ncbi:response regulator transcription factor [Niastella caeni]|uniref:Response regulator transcription factor n=1 Tax=Niastella caeni TaxID=2569763 RepID=A0A4S8HLF7_9BACT|nr:response regulator transcription factor [Niastella caeni]THU36047.1 response regulator transcription factor [Niastella caeni]